MNVADAALIAAITRNVTRYLRIHAHAANAIYTEMFESRCCTSLNVRSQFRIQSSYMQ